MPYVNGQSDEHDQYFEKKHQFSKLITPTF